MRKSQELCLLNDGDTLIVAQWLLQRVEGRRKPDGQRFSGSVFGELAFRSATTWGMSPVQVSTTHPTLLQHICRDEEVTTSTLLSAECTSY